MLWIKETGTIMVKKGVILTGHMDRYLSGQGWKLPWLWEAERYLQ